MKLSKSHIKQLIKEELQHMMQEQKMKPGQWERDHERKKVAGWLKGIATQLESAQEQDEPLRSFFAEALPKLNHVVKFMRNIAAWDKKGKKG